MSPLSTWSLRGFLLLSAWSSSGCGGGLPEPFALDWRGVTSGPAPSDRVRAALPGKTFRVEPTVDRRPDASRIGVDEETQYQYRTTTHVAAFCSDRIKDMVSTAGLKTVEQGDYVLQSEILELGVTEGGLFDGTARVVFRVFKPGRTAFEATYEGKSKRWGRSHSTENINEALSNALASATEKFLQDDRFADALGGKGTSSAAPAAPAPAPTPAAPAPAVSAKPRYNL